jgi:ferrous iron transport protein B
MGFFFSLQGLTLMALYLLGFFMAIVSAVILNKILKFKINLTFVVEMPSYKIPLLKIFRSMFFGKTKASFWCRKNHLALSIILWFWVLMVREKNSITLGIIEKRFM